MYNVPTVMYCTQHYWVSRLCTQPQNTVNQKICISPETCNTFCNKASWVIPHYFTWRRKLTHFTKCAVPVTWQGQLTPWRCEQKISPKFSKMLAHFSQTAILHATCSVPREPTSYLACPVLFHFVSNTTRWAEVQKPSNHISQCICACWPCTQTQNTIKCAANAHISTGSPTSQGAG